MAYQGPLGGLTTALSEATCEWMLAVAADMPHLTSEVVGALWELRGDADAVVPVTEKGLEPLLALYRVAACLPAAREVLSTGRRRPVAVFSRVTTVEVPADALRSVDPDLRSLVNVNTPADLIEAREAAEGEPRYVRGGVKLEVMEVSSRRSTRSMPSELPVTIYLNDKEIATTQATPVALEDLAAGFLLSEGLALRARSADRHRRGREAWARVGHFCRGGADRHCRARALSHEWLRSWNHVRERRACPRAGSGRFRDESRRRRTLRPDR